MKSSSDLRAISNGKEPALGSIAHMILAGDIGGTKVNLGLFKVEGQHVKLVWEEKFPSQNYPHLEDIVREFLAAHGKPIVTMACFGVAGPVQKGQAKLTNLPWRIEAETMLAELNCESVSLINDLEANAYGLVELKAEDFYVLNKGEPGAVGNMALISAGTGLGQAGLFWNGHQHHPFACEGGHCDFAPHDALGGELFVHLSERFGHVSWEKVLSGKGQVHIYEFLRKRSGKAEPAWLTEEMSTGDRAAVISRAAMEGRDEVCCQAMDLFVTYYGVEAGNLALKLMSTGGIFIGGGIAPKILPRLQQGKFLEAMSSKGRLKPLLSSMPVKVILNPKTALLGAAHFATFGNERFKVTV